MLRPPRAILDTSALLCLYHVDVLSYLSLLFDEVRVPEEVQQEFFNAPSEAEKSKRFAFLHNFYQDNDTWFIPCNEYGEDLITIYLSEKGMDRGEAEALAQNQFYDSLYQVIIDEKIARKIARNNEMEIRGTLSLLADMELSHGLLDYRTIVKRLIDELGTRFSQKVIDLVYNEALKRANT